MTLVGVIGILIGLIAAKFAFVTRTRLRIAIFALAFFAHVGCGLIYYVYAMNYGSDASIYYFGVNGEFEMGFGLTTQFIVFLVQNGKAIIGGTYLDYFMIFQAFGFFGIAFLMRAMEEVYAALELPQPAWSYLLLFLPGIHFWTSAIGKDGLLFTACCLSLWAAMQLRRRYLALGFAILLMVLIRPHIAAIAVVAAAWAIFADRTTRPWLRGLLIVGSVGALAAAVSTMKNTFSLDITNLDSISDFLAVRDNVMASSSADELGNTAVLDAPYPVKVFSFLFRPLFIDAEGAFGYIASFENLIFLFIFSYVMLRLRTLLVAIKSVPFVRYAFILSMGITLALSIDYYNVGLGLRQKTMVVPGFLIVVIALAAIKNARNRVAQTAQPIRTRPQAA